jgi:hypothetical protein
MSGPWRWPITSSSRPDRRPDSAPSRAGPIESRSRACNGPDFAPLSRGSTVVVAILPCNFRAEPMPRAAHPHLIAVVLTALMGIAALPQPALAEKADRNQQMFIEADRQGKADLLGQVMVYSGNVVISQGSMLLRAERIEMRTMADGYRAAQATGLPGKPATWRQRPRGQTLEPAGPRRGPAGRTPGQDLRRAHRGQGRAPGRRRRRGGRPARPQRRRQDHHLLHGRRPGARRRRRDPHRRPPMQGLPIHRRSRLGLSYLPQEASIFRKLTVEENIRAVLELQIGPDGKRCPGAIDELLESCCTTWASRSCATRRRRRCRAASGGAWRSPARWPPSRVSSCSTSPSPASTRSR